MTLQQAQTFEDYLAADKTDDSKVQTFEDYLAVVTEGKTFETCEKSTPKRDRSRYTKPF